MSDEREMLAEVLRDVLDACTCTPYPAGDGPEIDCPMHGRADFQGLACADAILASPQFARLIAAAKGEALREAADELARNGHRSAVTRLRDRAALTAEPAPTEGEGA